MWKYVGELVGKGLEWYVILEFILYSIPYLIPRSLPLAVLLSTLMVFGNLGERYELVAIKSAGISLINTMMPLIFIMLLLGAFAFYSSNSLIPKANLSFYSLLWDVKEKKPAMDIKDGVFYNQINGFAIRVDKKHKETNRIDGVLIYQETTKSGVSNVILAKTGTMEFTEDKRYLKLTLEDGKRYQEMVETGKYNETMPHNLMSFKQYSIALDLSELQLKRTNPQNFMNNFDAQNLDEIDSLVKDLNGRIKGKTVFLTEYIKPFYHHRDSNYVERKYDFSKIDKSKSYYEILKSSLDSMQVAKPDTIKYVEDEEEPLTLLARRNRANAAKKPIVFQPQKVEIGTVVESATQTSRNIGQMCSAISMESKKLYERRNRFMVQWHKKFTLAYSCLMLFFIGAPLGAIIRKGGFGTPMVVAILLFIVYFITQTVGEKLARESVLEVWTGGWFAQIIFTPIALFLTYKATTDSALFSPDAYVNFIRRFVPDKNKS